MQAEMLTDLFSTKGLILVGLLIAMAVFLAELYKFFKYKTHSELLDLSLMAWIFLITYFPFEDPFLSLLSAMLAIMIMGVYELRESPVWVRLMAAFTVSYAWIMLGLVLEKLVTFLQLLPIFGISNPLQISGFTLSTTPWVLLIFFFAFFGKRFLLVSRFLSPQYVYLFLYALLYLVISGIPGIDWQFRFLGIIIINGILYLLSGYLLHFIFGIRSLDDNRVRSIVKKVQLEIKTPVRRIGIVNAPIINAFAYGPWFDQRIAFIVKNIDDFKDDEILGIATHELAHLKHKHTLWLLFLGWGEQIARFAIGIPASVYDFVADVAKVPNSSLLGYINTASGVNFTWSLASYYIVNILIFGLMLIVVRSFEAQADRTTIRLGHGRELGKALYRLESFYQGIAGELGMNAQLLMDRQRSIPEGKRFEGEAATELSAKLMNPSRYAMIMNLIVSHPPTAFRIAAILDPEAIGTLRLAALPILLVLPVLRPKNMSLLRRKRTEFNQLLTEKFCEDWKSVDSFVDVSFLKENSGFYIGRQIIAFEKYAKRPTPIFGTVTGTEVRNDISHPLQLSVRLQNGSTMMLDFKSHDVKIFEPGKLFLLKDMTIALLNDFQVSKNGRTVFTYKKADKLFQRGYVGAPLEDVLPSERPIFLHTRGKTFLVSFAKINNENIQQWIMKNSNTSETGMSFRNVEVEVNGTGRQELSILRGKDMIVSVPPFILPLHKKLSSENQLLINGLAEKSIALTMYSAIDPDIGIPLQFRRPLPKNSQVDSGEEFEFRMAGDETAHRVKMKQIDAIVVKFPYYLVQLKAENGFFSRLLMKMSNRGEMKYSS